MRKHLFTAALLLPATALATALPASAGTSADTGKGAGVKAQSVSKVTAKGAKPLVALRSTGQTCSGTVVSRQVLKDTKGAVLGELLVYAKPANKGTVIACFKHAGVTKGKRLPTAVSLGAAKTAKATQPAVLVTAKGNFVSWAGPAVVGGAKGQCVQAAGAIQYKGKAWLVTSPVICDK